MSTPTLVQYSTFASAQGNASSLRWLPLPNAVLSGNCVIVGFTCSDSETPTVSDDKSNTYSVLINADDAGHGQRAIIAYCLNVTNAPTKVKLTGTAFTFTSATVLEFYNVATSSATDGSNSATGTTNNPKPASFTTAVNGDLIVYFAVRDDASLPITSITAPTGTLVSADVEDAWIAQYQIQSTAGAIQPAVTWNSSAYSWIAVAGAFKAATAGTAPTASPRVVGVHHAAINRAGTGSGGTWQFPTGLAGGNSPLLYASFVGVSADSLTSITDNMGNSWVATGPNVVNGGSGNTRAFYAKAPNLGPTHSLTLSYGGAGAIPGDTLMFYECVGMDQSRPFDSQVQSTGNQAAGTSFSMTGITPRLDTGIVFFTVGVNSNTVTGMSSPSGAVWIASTDPTEEFSPWPNDENNGWGFKVNTDKSTLTPTWTNDIAVGTWAGMADAFKSNAALSPYPRQFVSPWLRSKTGVLTGVMAVPHRVKGGAASLPTIIGTITVTTGDDIMAASGTTTVVGTLADTSTNDTMSMSGTTTVVGTLTVTGGNDTMNASGTSGSGVVGTLAVTGGNDTMSASGTTTIVGTLTVTGGNDSMVMSGTTTVVGTFTVTNQNDTMNASGFPGNPPTNTSRLPSMGVGT